MGPQTVEKTEGQLPVWRGMGHVVGRGPHVVPSPIPRARGSYPALLLWDTMEGFVAIYPLK